MWKCQEMDVTSEEQAIISDLSEDLQAKIKTKVNTSVLNECKFLKQFSRDFIAQLTKHLEFKTIGHENDVEYDSPTDPWLVYIQEGHIESYFEKSEGGL
jgi:hypothetical protein